MARENYLGVFGHVAIDTLASVEHFPEPNHCEAIIERTILFGGTGANLAAGASRLGVKTALASFVGDDFPIAFREVLEEMAVDLTDMVTIEGGRTPLVILISDGSNNQIGYVDQGVMRDQDRFPLLEHTIKNSKVVHVGTGRPGYSLNVCKRARDEGKKIAFDPAQELNYVYTPEEFSKVLPIVDMFFCNETELRIALNYLDMREPEELLRFIDMLVITMGNRGSRILTRDGEDVTVPSSEPRKVVDTTGAGDAYRAGFYAGLSHKLSLEGCGAVASACASFAVESLGGQARLPSWEEVQRRAFGHRTQ